MIESSFDGHDAHLDATNRLGEFTEKGKLPINTAVAVSIDARFRTLRRSQITDELATGGLLRYAIHQKVPSAAGAGDDDMYRTWPSSGFATGTIYDIANLIPVAANPKEFVEKVASEVATLVNQAADRLEMVLPEMRQQKITELVHKRTPLKGLRTTMVLWLNALLTQQRLSIQGVSSIPPLSFGSRGNLVPSEIVEVWQAILHKNWRSIFEPAVMVLRQSTSVDPFATSSAIQLLVDAVEKIEVSRLGLHINVGAELFPKLSDDQKQAAAFYTQPATAELLASMTIRTEDLTDKEWKSGHIFSSHSIADMACGTGTLLRAGFKRVCSIHEQAGGTLTSVKDLHRGAMEKGLVGTDISPIAAHLTTSSLAAIGSGEPYGGTRIGWLEVGGPLSLTGALEYLLTSEMSDLFDKVAAGRSTGSNNKKHVVVIDDASIDWILMNPPYSRTRGGQSAFDVAGLSEQERKKCQVRWRKQVRNKCVNNKAGMAASFLALAKNKIRPGGRIGFVLPLSAAFADSWSITREMIRVEFEDIRVLAVTSGKALGRDALSADTGMEEMLLVATRRRLDQRRSPSPIKCVTLFSPPNRIGEAGEIARAISSTMESFSGVGTSKPLIVGEDELGQVVVFEPNTPRGSWSPLGVSHAELALAAEALINGEVKYIDNNSYSFGIEMGRVEDVFEVGPTHHLIGHIQGTEPIGAFEIHKITKPKDAIGADRSLWHADSKTQRTLVVLPTHKGVAVANVGSEKDREKMRKRISTTFYARNMRWTSQCLLVASTKRPALGGRSWTTLDHRDKRVLKAFVLWANSTFGMVTHWTQGQRTHSGRSTSQVGAIKITPCPQLDFLNDDQLEQAVAAFDRLAVPNLLPACQAHVDSTRAQIDRAVIQMLSLPAHAEDTISQLRFLWCSEPSVHGFNKSALRLLEP